MSKSHIGSLLSIVGHGRLRSSFNELDSVDGLTATLTLAKIISVTLLVGFVTRLLYNVFLHPLSKVPGPKWYGANGLPRYLLNSSGYAHLKLLELHGKYGEVVRIGPNEVSTIAPRSWSDIYGQKRVASASGHGYEFVENGKEDHFFHNATVPTSLLAMPMHAHVTARKNLNSAFSAKAVADQEHLIKHHIDMLVKLLHEAAQKSTETKTAADIASFINWTLFDVIGDLAFGEPFGSLANGAEHTWVSMVPFAIQGGVLRANVVRLLGTRIGNTIMKFLVPKEVQYKLTTHRAMSAQRFERRCAMGASRPDFVSPMFEDPEFWNEGRMRGTITTFITAGSETSSTTLASAVYYLAATKGEKGDKSPMAKLKEELMAHFTSDDEITFSSARNLPYLSAVIDETLRMHPPVATVMPREVRDGGIVVEGYYMPGKTVIGVTQYAAFHSETNFFQADNFMPERWLGTDSRFANDRKDVFQPFSYGPRNCLGRTLAYAEMRAILARIIFNFDIELRPESSSWDKQESYVVWDKGPLYVNLRSRVQ